MVELKNGRYVDENNNSWNTAYETQESAEAKSKSLIGCSGCSECSGCLGCWGCSGCSGYKQNPQRIVSPKLGSRDSQTSLYWVGENVQIVCGCFRGDIPAFRAAVVKKHAGTNHEKAYMAWISAAEAYIATVQAI